MIKDYLAHKDGLREQTLKEHSENTALLCQKNASYLHPQIAYNAALVHDIGKLQSDFQDKLNGKNISVDHSTVGAKFVFELNPKNPINQMIAYAVAGHHAGLPNGGLPTDNETPSLVSRLKKQFPDIRDRLKDFCKIEIPNAIPDFRENASYTYPMYIRMLASTVVDSDFIDTENFMSGIKNRGFNVDFSDLLDKLNKHLSRFDDSSKIAASRQRLSDQVYRKADNDNSVFLLDMPTGSGKTLTSMRFALARAIKKNKKRIIYVIPYTSIIEQNARVFKDIFGEDIVIEHHSNFDPERFDPYDMEKYELSTENWDAPIIVTTNVQFFESVYSNKPSKLRKLHNIQDSIVCFDEAQVMPLKLFRPCMEAISVLSTKFGVDVVLMSATMPDFLKYCPSLKKCEDLITDKTDYGLFKRCEINDLGYLASDDLVLSLDFSKSNLIIVNSKKEARLIYDKLPKGNKVHLSTFQTPYDRQIIIREIREALINEQAITAVSTSLIEAGVDLDFDFVYREINGLDSIMQAAGRCNREGKKNHCATYIFKIEETDKIKDKDTRLKISITETLLHKYSNFYCAEAVREYFDKLYILQNDTLNSMDFAEYVKCMIWKNEFGDVPFVSIAFADYAERFKYIEDGTMDIVIAITEEALQLMEKAQYSLTRNLRRKLQKFTVSVHKNIFDALHKSGAINCTEEGVLYISNEIFYDKEKGIIYNDNDKENFYIV